MVRQSVCLTVSPDMARGRQGLTISDDWPESLPITREELDLLKCHMNAIIADMIMVEEA